MKCLEWIQEGSGSQEYRKAGDGGIPGDPPGMQLTVAACSNDTVMVMWLAL